MASKSLSELIAVYEQQRSDLMDALTKDAKNPVPDYSVGGQSVSRTQWRQSLLDQIEGIDRALKRYRPVEIRSIGI